jgi:AraC-like DNA-binding protein
LAYLGLASKSLEDALKNLERYSRVLSEAIQVRLSIEDQAVILEGIAERDLLLQCGQATEFTTGLLLSAYRACTGRHITPIEVRFVHHREKNAGELKRIFGCSVSFGCVHFEQVLNRSDLAIPIPSSDSRLLSLLKKHAETVLSERGTNRPDLLQRLERRVIELLPNGHARAKILAGEMGMSPRTFHRRLEESGTTFAEVVDRLRHELAMKYVVDRQLSMTEVAFLLGYSNQSAFSTAFRRWTGKPPRAARASLH